MTKGGTNFLHIDQASSTVRLRLESLVVVARVLNYWRTIILKLDCNM